jgi:hypothetical protein
MRATAEEVLKQGDALKFAHRSITEPQVADIHDKLRTTLAEEKKVVG